MRRPQKPKKQLLHLVFGGRLTSPEGVEFESTENLDVVGIYSNYAEAEAAWRGRAQATIDQADVRYFIVHMHRLMDPETGDEHGDDDD
ncbi:MAG: DUF4170 domain-containing protein [Alphaproteobacteria bacterium]